MDGSGSQNKEYAVQGREDVVICVLFCSGERWKGGGQNPAISYVCILCMTPIFIPGIPAQSLAVAKLFKVLVSTLNISWWKIATNSIFI